MEIHATAVARLRRAYVDGGVTSALERTRSDRVYARTFDGADEAHLIAVASWFAQDVG